MSSDKPTDSGKSSYDLIDVPRFWQALNPTAGMHVLDLASGAGAYSLPLAERVGPRGRVFAVDLWAEGLEQLKADAGRRGLDYIETHLADAGRRLPLGDQSVDLCLMATVLHDFVADGIDREVLQQVARVLKPRGVLALVEFKKQDGPPGPPLTIRLSLEEAAAKLQPFGFIRFSAVIELGPHIYFARFRRLAPRLK